MTTNAATARSSATAGEEPTEDPVHADPSTLSNERLAHMVRQAARAFVRSLQYRLAGQHVTFGHWIFLRLLWQTDGLTQRELSEAAGLVEPTTHSALRKLEELGLVTRRNLPGNRRKLHVFLTPEGWALRGVLEPLAEEVNGMAIRGIPEEDIATTRRTLLAIIGNLVEDENRAIGNGMRIPPTRGRV